MRIVASTGGIAGGPRRISQGGSKFSWKPIVVENGYGQTGRAVAGSGEEEQDIAGRVNRPFEVIRDEKTGETRRTPGWRVSFGGFIDQEAQRKTSRPAPHSVKVSGFRGGRGRMLGIIQRFGGLQETPDVADTPGWYLRGRRSAAHDPSTSADRVGPIASPGAQPSGLESTRCIVL